MNYKIRLNNASSCKRFVQRIINEVYQGEIDLEKAKILNQLVKTMLDCIDKVDLETKIDEITRQLEEMKNDR